MAGCGAGGGKGGGGTEVNAGGSTAGRRDNASVGAERESGRL